MRRNPKMSAPDTKKATKPKAPTPAEVPDEEIDHAKGNPAAVAIKEDQPPEPEPLGEAGEEGEKVDAAGAYDPATEDPEATDEAPVDQTQKPGEGDPGKVKREKHVRGVAPGDRVTF
jgi:hypothetical protein